MHRIRNALPLIYLTVVFVLIVADFAIHADPRFQWCGSQETEPECVRNWLNAGGVLLTVMIAGAAAIFTYLQFEAARTQANFSMLPSIDDRIDAIENILREINTIGFDIKNILEQVEQFQPQSAVVSTEDVIQLVFCVDSIERHSSIIVGFVPRIRNSRFERLATAAHYSAMSVYYDVEDLHKCGGSVLASGDNQRDVIAYRLQFNRLIRKIDVDKLRTIWDRLGDYSSQLQDAKSALVAQRDRILCH